MSYAGFILRAFAISPIVFLRFVPIFGIFVLITWGLFQATDNVYVIAMIGFMLATIGQTFLYITGVRGALQTIRATDAPTVEGLMKVTMRAMITLMLVMLLMVIALTGGLYLALSTFVLAPETAAAGSALAGLIGAAFSFDPERLAEAAETMAAFADDPAPVNTAVQVFALCQQLATGIVISVFGVPLAAMAANAVQRSPGNDLIFGIGRYVPHQFTLYLLATILPTYVFAGITPFMDLAPEGDAPVAIPLTLLILAAWSVYAPCVSFAGMAIGYQQIQRKVWGMLQRERVPDIDYEAERENVRALREMRRVKTNETSVYDPRKQIDELLDVGTDPDQSEEEFEDEVRTSLRAMRQARRGPGGARMYDPRNPGGTED